MKNFILFTLALLSFSLSSQDITAYLYTNNFNAPQGTYIEQQFSVNSYTVEWKEVNNAFQANLELTYIFKKDTQIVKFTKEKFSSEMIDNLKSRPDFIMNFQRIKLEEGDYNLEIIIDDLNDTLDAFRDYSFISFRYPDENISISSLQAIDSYSKTISENKFTKGNYDLKPYPVNLYPSSRNKLILYSEIYNTNIEFGEDEKYLLVYYLKNTESNIILPNYKSFEKRSAKDIDIIIKSIDITDLPDGKFQFVMEVINKKNEVVANKSYYFLRSNPELVPTIDDISKLNINQTFAEKINNLDTLSLMIASMSPISGSADKKFANILIDKGDIYPMQQYLYMFWKKRKPDNPEQAFRNYMDKVSEVEQFYRTPINRGYESDRGRVYLQYGEPNVISKNHHEPNNLPYEIWQYYQIGNQSDIKFIFYTPDRSSNEFVLLHSNAVGEISNYRWRFYLRGSENSFESIDDTGERDDDWGSQLNKNLNNPR